MPDIFDTVQPEGDVFDKVATDPTPAPDSGLVRAGKGVLRAAGLPDSMAALQANPPSPSIASLLTGPVGGSIIDNAVTHGKAAINSFQQQKYADMFGHALEMIPGVGQFTENQVDAANRAKTGDVAGGVAQSGAGIAQMLGLGKALAPEEAPVQGPVLKVPASEEHFQSTVAKPLAETFQPDNANLQKVIDAARRSVPELQQTVGQKDAYGVINKIDLQTAPRAITLADAKLKGQFDRYVQPAIQRGDMVDGNVVADAKMASIPDRIKVDQPAQYQKLKEDADVLRRPMTIPETYTRLQQNNAQLDPYYRSSQDARSAAELANPKIADLKAETEGYRQALYKAIDPENDGQNVGEIQKRRSALVTTRQQIEGLNNDQFKQPTLSPGQNLVKKGMYAVDVPGKVIHGEVGDLFKQYTENYQHVNNKFSRVFNNYKGQLADVPEPGNRITPNPTSDEQGFQLKPSSGPVPFSVQRMLFGDDTPAYKQGEEVGTPHEQLELHQQGPQQTFSRQHSLIGSDSPVYSKGQDVGTQRPPLQLKLQDPTQKFARQRALDEMDWGKALIPESR